MKIIEESNYYPFGLKHENYNAQKYDFKQNALGTFVVLAPTQNNDYKYKFENKEYQDELGLNMYDFGARGYMPDLGRTTTYDPLCEKFSDLSPQSFLNNNPLSFVDPTGMESKRYDGVVYGNGHWSDSIRAQSGAMGESSGEDSEETPPDDITVGSNGKVTNIVKNGKPNRIFDENGNQLFFNDSENDSEWTEGLKVGDKLYENISTLFVLQRLMKAGVTFRGGFGGMWRTGVDSYANADFGVNQLKDIYNVNNTEYDGHAEGNGMFFRINGQKSIYNFADFSQFLWGGWMKSNNYMLFEAKGGAHLNNMFFGKGFLDTPADQRAIQNGFNYMTNLFNTWKK